MILESLKLHRHFEEFRAKKPNKYEGKYLLILSLRRDVKNPKLGVRISRRIGNAVRRNRIRRIVREAFRQHLEDIPAGFHYLVIPRANTKELSNRQLSLGLRKDLSRGLGFRL